MVPVDDLTPGNIGGPVWAALKAAPDEGLKWTHLSRAKLWTDKALYEETVHKWLTSDAQDFNVEVQRALTVAEGEVHVADIEVGERVAKLNVGPTGLLLQKRAIVDVIYIEVDEATTALPTMSVSVKVSATRSESDLVVHDIQISPVCAKIGWAGQVVHPQMTRTCF